MIEPSKPPTEIISSLEDLSQEPGFLYTLAILLRIDLFLHPEDSDVVDWSLSLSFQEFTLLIGLMVKHDIQVDIVPTRKQSEDQLKRTEELLQQLHWFYTRDLLEAVANIAGNNSDRGSEGSDQPFFDLFLDGERLVEPIFYAGSGAYAFQYLDLARKKYKHDEDWIQTDKDLSVVAMTQLASKLKSLTETKARVPLGVDDFEAFCRACLSVFCFSYEDIEPDHRALFSSFIDTFSVVPGKVNEDFDSIGAYNVVQSNPIVVLDNDLYFLPVGFNLAQSIYESPFYWMGLDKTYENVAA